MRQGDRGRETEANGQRQRQKDRVRQSHKVEQTDTEHGTKTANKTETETDRATHRNGDGELVTKTLRGTCRKTDGQMEGQKTVTEGKGDGREPEFKSCVAVRNRVPFLEQANQRARRPRRP